MIRRVLAAAVLVAVLGACAADGRSPATTLPPTTRVPTPIEPTGLVDTVRRWVRTLEAGGGADGAAFAVLGPGSQAAIGGREGYTTVRDGLRRRWARWAAAGVTYDGLPVADGLAVVRVSAPDEETGVVSADAVPMRARSDDWAVEPLLDTGPVSPTPVDRAEIGTAPELQVETDEGVQVTAYVDTQPAEVDDPVPAGAGRATVTYRPRTGLRPGPHLVTLVFRQGEAVTARVLRYEAVAP